MASTRTENRKRKIGLLRDAQNKILDLLMLEHQSRERINMAKFKELNELIDIMISETKEA